MGGDSPLLTLDYPKNQGVNITAYWGALGTVPMGDCPQLTLDYPKNQGINITGPFDQLSQTNRPRPNHSRG